MEQLTVEQLLSALDDKTPIVRNSAVQELGKRKEKLAVEKLIELLKNDENALVRDNAAYALCEIGDVRSIPSLIEALKDKDEWVRKSAAKALGILKARDALTSLISLTEDPSPSVRKAAVRSLGQIGDIRAEPYIKKLCHDSNILVKKYAIQALEMLKKR